MKKQKAFDCVEMKDAIQRKLREERSGMTDEQQREALREQLDTSQSTVAVWWRKIRAERSRRTADAKHIE